MIILALDYGTKRIGVAKGDTESCIACTFGFIENKNNEFVLSEIKKIIKEEWIDEILIGLPRSLSGEKTSQTEYTQNFINKVKETFPKLKISTIDERLSSREAYTMTSKKEHIDDIAAMIFLQAYLDKINHN